MADLTKKLPFKPTALRNARPKPTPSSSTEDDALQASAAARYHRGGGRSDDYDGQDDLAMFRRAKEMAPIIEADRERRMRRQLQKQQQEQEAERRRTSAGSKHSLVTEGEDGGGAGGGAEATTPTATATQASTSISEDVIMATQEEDNRELVTPPPSKRSRRDTSGSSPKHKDVDLNSNTNTTESAPDSPTMRAMRSLAPDRSITPALYNTSLYSSGAIASASSMHKTRLQTRGPPPGSQVIQLDSDSEPETTTTAAVAAAPVEIVDQALTLDLDLNADAPEDDDEFAEYVRRAQEERDRHLLQKEHEALAAAAAATPSPTPASQPPPSTLSSPAPSQAAAAKQVMDLVITSDIPGTRMCLVKFRFDRPLRVVRDSWTALQHRHGIPLHHLLDRDDDVVLTWRRRKVYMTSTLRSLGIRPSDDGSAGAASVEGAHSREGFNESRTRVHMQAWTPALFAQMEREEEAAAARRQRDGSSHEADAGGTQATEAGGGGEVKEAEEEAAEEVQLRIILKSRDSDPVKLKVRPETTTETLVAAFCAQRAVREGADVGLWFDGMRLQGGATMEDADIDDMDTIEVHVK